MRSTWVALGCVVGLAAGGCAVSDAGDTSRGAGTGGGEVPLTPRTLAALVADDLPGDLGEPTSLRPTTDLDEAGKGVVAAVELRYPDPADDQSDGTSVTVGVGQGLEEAFGGTCAAWEELGAIGCDRTGTTLVAWEEAAAGEDPGVVYVLVDKGRTDVVLFTSGGRVTGDPRDLDLPVGVDDLVAVAEDARVDVTTSQEAVDAGADLRFWRDPGS